MRSVILILFLFPQFCTSQAVNSKTISTSKSTEYSTQSLDVNDLIPDFQINNIHRSTDTFLKFSSFKNKLLIIDFWATWCTSCIKKFPLLDSLQTEYKDKLQVVLVSKKSRIDTRERICSFFEKFKNPADQHYTFPAIVGDTLIHSLFPHEAIPFYVIIGPDSKVKAFLQWDQLTRENILFYLNQEND